ncbi:MAG: diguanylate cyclase [bacterium]
MKDKGKTKEQLMDELKRLRSRLTRYRKKEAECKSVENELGQRVEMFKALFDQVSDSIFIIEMKKRKGSVIVDANIAAGRMHGYERDELIGKSIRLVDAPETAAHIQEQATRLYQGERLLFEGEHVHRNGTVFPVEISAHAVKLGEQTLILSISRDIGEQKNLEEKLKAASITDALTGLLNRRGFFAFAQKQLEISIRHKRNFSVLFLDLDDMKAINDDFGHQEGDRALVDMANTLRKTFRASDIIARMGGDEFTILITEPNRSVIEKTVKTNLEENLRQHNEGSEKPYSLSVSMGMSHFDPEHPSSLEELLARADELMYKDKLLHQFEKAGVRPPRIIKSEKRFGKRLPVEQACTAELVVPDQAVIKNISSGGVCMRTVQRLMKHSIYRVRLRVDDSEEIEPKGIVVWSSLIGRVARQESMSPSYEAGLRFIELSESAKKFLTKFITNVAA